MSMIVVHSGWKKLMTVVEVMVDDSWRAATAMNMLAEMADRQSVRSSKARNEAGRVHLQS